MDLLSDNKFNISALVNLLFLNGNSSDAIVSSKGQQITEELSDDVLETWSFIGDESYDAEDQNQISIRRLFVPRPDYSLVSFDYSQMEVRVFMSYFRNEVIDELLKLTSSVDNSYSSL